MDYGRAAKGCLSPRAGPATGNHRSARLYRREEAPAGGEFPGHLAPSRPAGGGDVIQDAVHGIFIEDAEIPVSEQVELESLELEAKLLGLVANGEHAEIG